MFSSVHCRAAAANSHQLEGARFSQDLQGRSPGAHLASCLRDFAARHAPSSVFSDVMEIEVQILARSLLRVSGFLGPGVPQAPGTRVRSRYVAGLLFPHEPEGPRGRVFSHRNRSRVLRALSQRPTQDCIKQRLVARR